MTPLLKTMLVSVACLGVAVAGAPSASAKAHHKHHAASSAKAGGAHGKAHAGKAGHGKGAHGKGKGRGKHKRGGDHETVMHTHERHASLCQTVTVKHRQVQKCRG